MLLKAHNLHKTFLTGTRKIRRFTVLDGVDISLNHGETLGVVGPSGAGKTTLALILAGLAPPDQGEVRLKGMSVWPREKAASKEIRRRIQIVWQHPETAFNPRWRLGRSMLEPYRIHGLPVKPGQVEAGLRQVGLGMQVLNRRPRQLSGGELQRLVIARAMSLNPEVVMLDEPTSMLDAITQAQVIRLLQEIQKSTGVAYLFISHSPDLIRHVSTQRMVLTYGKLTRFFDRQVQALQGGKEVPEHEDK
jgi:peptide/nickel transport system ATP-binding protein